MMLTHGLEQPSATGQNWEKYSKKFADDEIEEKKITPLSDEYEHDVDMIRGMADGSIGIFRFSRRTELHHTRRS